MLIKIRTSNTVDSWRIIDNVDSIEYSESFFTNTESSFIDQLSDSSINPKSRIEIYGDIVHPHLFDSFVDTTFYDDDLPPAPASGTGSILPPGKLAKIKISKGYNYAWIKYYIKEFNMQITILHNTYAYICNNEGKTIHRSVVNPSLITCKLPEYE